MLDLEPATNTLTGLVEAVRDEQLTAPSPCADMMIGDLLDHVDGLAWAFTAAATKTLPADGGPGPSADASRLGEDWRPRIRERLANLARAWRDPAAWAGTTQAGGFTMPAQVAGLVALNEVVVHGWDLAAASGQRFDCEPSLLEAAYGFVESAAAENPDGSPGLFGPRVAVPDDAPLLDRLIGLSGRDPSWRSGADHR